VALSQLEAGNPERLACTRIGAPLLFGRLWEETGCRAVIEDLLSGRAFEFPVERAVFATVLHRIMVSGSDRACETWLADYDIPGVDGLALHHFYRAMAWLGEELGTDQQGDATPFAPRTVKDLIEERLFARRRDLFSELYRRYLRATAKKAFEIDPGKLAEEARYDGLFVLRTNARITPLQAVLRYRDLIQVEQLFRTAKALMRTRPIYHSSASAIRGHVFCSFLALILRKELDERCRTVGFRPEWGDVLRDLDRLQEVAISKDGRQMTLRTPATGVIGPLFKAARMALPPNVCDASAT
jgi:hypothetical protein